MNKKNFLLAGIGLIVIIIAIVLIVVGNKGVRDINKQGAQSKVGVMDENVTPQSTVDVPETIDWKKEAGADFKVDFMSDEEKEALGIEIETKVQVLARDKETGIVLAYKVINSDADIINSLEE